MILAGCNDNNTAVNGKGFWRFLTFGPVRDRGQLLPHKLMIRVLGTSTVKYSVYCVSLCESQLLQYRGTLYGLQSVYSVFQSMDAVYSTVALFCFKDYCTG